MDNDTLSPRAGAARLRTVCLRAGALLVTLAALAATPAMAAAHSRRHHHAQHATRHHAARPHRAGFARAQAMTVLSPRTTARRQRKARTHRSHKATHPPTCPGAHTRVGREASPATQTAVVCLLNVRRTKAGLPTVRDSRSLHHSAQGWTNTMVRHRAFSHGSDFGARISAAGFRWSQIGENIAAGFATPAGVVTAWMHSTGHCENILNPLFREVGVGVDTGRAQSAGRRGTWTLDFGLGLRQHARSGDWAPAEHCPN
jgi:uncharacterized protein YkwD